jgi:hypothetical protein
VVTIHFTQAEETELEEMAMDAGLDLESFVREPVRERVLRGSNGMGENGGDGRAKAAQMLDQMLSGLTGLIESRGGEGGSRLSESTGLILRRI